MSEYIPTVDDLRDIAYSEGYYEFEQMDKGIRLLLAQVWDEGYTAGNLDGSLSAWDDTNPYR